MPQNDLQDMKGEKAEIMSRIKMEVCEDLRLQFGSIQRTCSVFNFVVKRFCQYKNMIKIFH